MMCKTVQEWNKCYIELIALYVHPKNSNHLRSHLRAIMALDHRRLGQAGKRIRPIFCHRQVYLTKSCQQIWWHANQPFILFFYTLHLRWNGTIRHCFYRKDLGQNAVFHKFARQIALIQYSGRSKHTWAFSETIHWRNFLNHLLWPGASLFWQVPNLQCVLSSVWMKINRVTLQHNKEFTMFIFYSMVL